MATIKIRFRRASSGDNCGTLYYQIIHHRQVKQIYTPGRLLSSEWDSDSGRILISDDCTPARALYLSAVINEINDGADRLHAIVDRLDSSGAPYSADDIVSAFAAHPSEEGVVSFTRRLVDSLRRMGKKAMARRYSLTLASLLRYTGNSEVSWDSFDSTLVSGFEEFLRKRGLCRNSTSFYMRNLRSIVNRASDSGFSIPQHPFRHVYLGIDKTAKRAVSLQTVCRIRDIDLSSFPHIDFARNLFMFAFYTRGMSFVDIAYLRKANLSNEVISYFRRKTGQFIQVRLESPTREVMERLGQSSNTYLLPIIRDESADTDSQYSNAYHKVNRNLRKLGEMLGLDTRLTLYVARHAWASIAHHNNVPLSTISRAMGHDSETTTLIYLSSIDTSVVDRANKKIITLLGGGSD